jgi:hypothetical protein
MGSTLALVAVTACLMITLPVARAAEPAPAPSPPTAPSPSPAPGAPAPPGALTPARTPVSCAERVAELTSITRRALRNDWIWTYTWTAAYVGLVIGNGVLSHTSSPDSHVDYYFGVGGSALGLLATLLGTVSEQRHLIGMKRRLAAVQNGSEAEMCAAAIGAERELAEVARLESRARSWIVHVGNVVVNAGLGIGLGAGYGRWRSAFIQTTAGIAIGEAQTLTRPPTAEKGLRSLELRPLGAGLALVGHF